MAKYLCVVIVALILLLNSCTEAPKILGVTISEGFPCEEKQKVGYYKISTFDKNTKEIKERFGILACGVELNTDVSSQDGITFKVIKGK